MAKRLERPPLPNLADSDEMFLHELSDTITKLHERHTDDAKPIYAELYVDEMDEAILRGDLVPEEAPIDPTLLTSLCVNLWTEEGLPYYYGALNRNLPKNHPFKLWLYRWTSDEGSHAPTIRGWLHRTRQVDMRMVEDNRQAMMISPDTPQPETFIDGVVYPGFQEPATEHSHRVSARRLPAAHRIGKKAIGAVTGHEMLHGDFYGDLGSAALEVDASKTIIAITRNVIDFAMPGKGIPDFDKLKKVISNAGFFGAVDLMKIFDDVVNTRWKIGERVGLTSQAEKAREYLFYHLGILQKLIDRKSERAGNAAASAPEVEKLIIA